MFPPDPHALPKLTAEPARRRAVISLTPLIDVVFILLIFFMLASSFLDWRTVDLYAAAPGNAAQASDAPPLVLRLDGPRIVLDGQTLDRDRAIARVQRQLQADPERTVYLQPLDATPLQPVIDLLDALQAAGISRMELIRDPAWSPIDPRAE